MADAIIGKVKAVITGDATGLQQAADKAEKSLKDIGTQAKKTSTETQNSMRQMAGVIGTAFATAKLVNFGRQAVMAAGDTAESLNATRVIFGQTSAAVEKFAGTASKSLGMSNKAALDAVNTFATFGKSAGLAGNELNTFSIDMLKLASDLASFRNTTPEDAIMAIGAALRGESEPIRRYGILLNEATLKQEALALGITNTTKGALDPQARVLAAQAAILKQSGDAMGDFARTSSSLSNQIKISNAQIADMKAKVGTALVPVVQGALQVLNPLVNIFNSLGTGTQKMIGQIVMLNATLILATKAIKAMGFEAAFAKKAMLGLNVAIATVVIVGKIFDDKTNENKENLKGFTDALRENDAALRTNAIQQLAAQDPALQQILTTMGSIGLTLGDLAQYYRDLSGPAAEFRTGLVPAASGAETFKQKIEQVNSALGLNINTTNLTEAAAERLWTQFTNLQELLFNIEQGWRTNKGATDATASALLGATTAGEEANEALDTLAGTFDKYRESVLGAALATERDFRVKLNDAKLATDDFIGSLSDGKVSSQEFENALMEQADRMLALQQATKGEIGALMKTVPTLRYMVQGMYEAGKAQDLTAQQTRFLINELGLLEGIDPRITIYMTMDIEQLRAQAAAIKKQIESLNMDAFTRNSPVMKGLKEQFEILSQLGDVIGGAGDFKPPPGGRGGGGGGGAFDWVKDWVKDLADFTQELFSKDFRRSLLEGTPEAIGDALEAVLKRGTELGLQLFRGGPEALQLIASVSQQLQAAADQLRREGGLEDRLDEATSKVRALEGAVADLEERFRDFQRVERNIGAPSTLQRLDEEIAKLDGLKTQLESAQQAYADFKGSGTSALDAQLSRLEELKSTLSTLEAQYSELNASLAGDASLSPLERERKALDALRSSLDELSRSRTDYSKSLTQQVSTVQWAEQGGILGQAKRYLAKASTFRDILTNLRDRSFPTSIIRDVLNAGIDGGTKLGRKLLSLSDADLQELKSVQKQIGAVASETGEVAASVLFDADVSAAQSAFNRQIGVVQNLYQQAIAQSRNEFNAQQSIVEGVYQRQIAAAQAAVEQQKTVIEALFRTAIAEAQGELEKARSTAQVLKTAIDDLRATMTSLISTIAQAVRDAQAAASQQQQNQQPAQGGTTTQPAPGGATIPGTNTPIQVGTGDTGVPAPGQKVGGPDRIWGGPGGGAVVDGIFIPPGTFKERALGGPVANQQSYLVGERGPEIFTPSRNGMIIPNDALVGGGGASTYNITVNARGDAGDIGRQVVKAIQEYERRNGTGWRS